MSYTVTQGDILDVQAQAVVVSVEMTMRVIDGPVSQRLAAVGGDALREAIRRQRYIPVGSARALEGAGLPFEQAIATAVPRWLNGKQNELLILRRCYQNVYDIAEALGCETIAMPFLSATYYLFPREEAVHIALDAAEKRAIQTIFVADTPALYSQSQQAYHNPEIVGYIGYSRDHAIFELDNGLFVRVDLRPEVEEVEFTPYFEACYRTGVDPLQPPLPEAEIERLKGIYGKIG